MSKNWRWLPLKSRIMWRLGLTHQFSCKECGAPIDEEISPHSWFRGMYRWRCTSCGWKTEGGHTPRVMKRQHRIVCAFRKLFWELKEEKT